MRMKRESIAARMERFEALCADGDFLSNKGLSNEVGLYIFAYPPKEEMAVRRLVEALCARHTGEDGCRMLRFDLYDLLLEICEKRRVLDKMSAMEAQRGQDFLCAQIQRIAPATAYVEQMRAQGHRPGDVVLLTGIGRVYPYMRSHNILNNLQGAFDDVPVVLFYPGEYNGQSLTLFELFMDDNYYRAFNLI